MKKQSIIFGVTALVVTLFANVTYAKKYYLIRVKP